MSETDYEKKAMDEEAGTLHSRDHTPHGSEKDYASQGGEEEAVAANKQNEEAIEKVTGPQLAVALSGPAAGPPGIPAIPDGGLQAWLQVLGAWCLFFNTWGLLNTFGVYQTYYESGALFHSSSSTIAWIGSLQAFFVLFIGFLTGPLFDRGYFRVLILTGSFGVVFGHMMLSLCKEYWQVILAQGFTIGLGAGCLFVPSVAIMPAYFRRNLGLALGLAASGSSTGGIIYPIMFYKLVGEVGFGWATRILGFTALATLLIPIFVMQQRFKPQKARSLVDLSALTELDYVLFLFGAMIGFIGLYTVLFYLSFAGQNQGITNDSLSFYLVPILNAGSVFGRTIPNFISDRIGPFNVMIPGALICGIIELTLISVDEVAGIVCVAVFFGFFSGIFVALPPVLFVALTEDKSKIGTRMGMGFGILSPAVFIGGPAAGAILGNGTKNLHWHHVWIFGGVCFLGSCAVFTFIRLRRSNYKLMTKI